MECGEEIEEESERLRFALKDWATGVCWPAGAGMEDAGSRKTLCPVKKADEIVLAGQAGRKGISRLRVVGLVRKNA